MTIRKTLLGAFLLVALAPAILLAGLAFVKARDALQSEIEHNLTGQADAIAAEMDKILFERLQNAAVWSQLDVMQDLQVQDVDRRLSSFLARVAEGYGGVYRNLSALNPAGEVVASSDPTALGTMIAPAAPWQRFGVAGVRVSLALPEFSADGESGSVELRTPVRSHFGDATLGELLLRVDWNQFDALLDRAAAGGRVAAVLDSEGRIVAASRSLRARGMLLGRELAHWPLPPGTGGAFALDGTPLGTDRVLVGVGRAATFAGFEGPGWRTLVIQPLDLALAPVRRMAAISLLLVAALILVTLAMATWVSGKIARPVVALTEFTRHYRRDRSLGNRPPAVEGEVGELADAFVDLMEDIDASQRKLVHASKLAVVGEMSSLIAHEVRTPLGIMRSSAQMLKREPGLSEEGRELTGFIESETERLNRLVSTMLDAARPRPPNFAPIDAHLQIHQTLALLAGQASARKVRLDEALAAKRPVVEADEEQLTQALLNLVMNALQILQPGGEVRVSTADAGEALAITIEDNGPGIPEDERERVFEAFFFRREGGVGLGLAIVQQIVQAHGGSITVGTGALGGAAFRIRLPRHRREQT